PAQPMPGWAGNAQRIEVSSFRAGRVSSTRDKSARIYVEFLPRRARKRRAAVQRSRSSLVIIEGWEHPHPPNGWVSEGKDLKSAKWPLFAPEWRREMDAFLTEYLRHHPSVRVLADFRSDEDSLSGREQPLLTDSQPPPFTHTSTAGLAAISSKPSGLADANNFVSPDEVTLHGALTEGAVKSILVNAYERSPEARRKCIEHYGLACFVCGFNFGAVYASTARGCIHVHHLKPLSELRAKYVVDPIVDLRPVCPNCHAVIHSREPQYTVDQVRAMIGNASSTK
ncbi:MAG: hypothetical protein DME21_10095, partial [Verrucomicrobia bacterium]